MRRVLRFVALANAFYQGAVGLIGVLSPSLIAALFRIGVPEPAEAGVIRLFCAFLCANALVLTLLAQQGPGARALARQALASGVVILFANLAACLGGDLRWGTLAVGLTGEVALVLTLLVWLRAPEKEPSPGSLSHAQTD